jgi:GrpB-like predicted nucleotidyltransferase (UPF0157 family)
MFKVLNDGPFVSKMGLECNLTFPSPYPEGYDPQKDKIEIADYDPEWPELFLKEKIKLEKALGKFPELFIEHFGSTSVTRLAAKPIIDIMISVESIKLWHELIKPLEELGYYFWAENKEEMLFIKGIPPIGEKRTHHVHIYKLESPRWKRELAFRDYLRIHPEEARCYETLKRELALKFTFDRDGYNHAKTNFIKGVLKKISLG